MKFSLLALAILMILVPRESLALKCRLDTREWKSDEFLNEVFKLSDVIGLFELTDIGPRTDGPIDGSYTTTLKFKSIKFIKGSSGSDHLHHYSDAGNMNYPVPLVLNRKYLVAFSRLEPRSKISSNGPCGYLFRVELKDADFYIKKFESFKKLEEKKRRLRINRPIDD